MCCVEVVIFFDVLNCVVVILECLVELLFSCMLLWVGVLSSCTVLFCHSRGYCTGLSFLSLLYVEVFLVCVVLSFYHSVYYCVGCYSPRSVVKGLKSAMGCSGNSNLFYVAVCCFSVCWGTDVIPLVLMTSISFVLRAFRGT